MLFRLCLALGYVHPDALLASLDSRQLGGWYAFLQIEPIGAMREDFRAGMICSTVANYAGRQRAENAGPAQPADFMPSLEALPRATETAVLMATPEEQAELIRNTLFGGSNG